MRFCPVLDCDGVDTYQEAGRQIVLWSGSTRFRGRDTIRTPLLYSPGQKLFRKNPNHVGGGGGPGRSYNLKVLKRMFLIEALC